MEYEHIRQIRRITADRPSPVTDFATKVTRWQLRHGRHDLPWQNTREPYRIWLSEVMLQQTQVATVIPYYLRFRQRFPNIKALAAAPLDEVLAMWSGLGYYARGRNLHRAAQQMVAEHRGRIPRSFEAVLALPGVGRSTAAAICVFAFGDRRAILDGNVKRLFARCFGIAGYPGDAKTAAKLWRKTEQLLPLRDVESYSQGLMDLGAAICVRGKPRCEVCPVAEDCVARRRGTIGRLPAPRPRKSLPQRSTHMLVLLHAGQVLLEKRAPSGIWGGLWSLPEVAFSEDIAALCAQRYGAEIATHAVLPAVAHSFTHFKLAIEPHRLGVARVEPRAAAPGAMWMPLEDALGAALPAPVRRILAALAVA
jgi:A/G-specific adenine glycosylase